VPKEKEKKATVKTVTEKKVMARKADKRKESVVWGESSDDDSAEEDSDDKDDEREVGASELRERAMPTVTPSSESKEVVESVEALVVKATIKEDLPGKDVGVSAANVPALCKNANRVTSDRRKVGCRGDWILRTVGKGNRDEYGAGEAGKQWMDKFGTKFMKESGVKLPKTMKDMLLKLMKKAKWNPERCSRIQTVGIVHAGKSFSKYVSDMLTFHLSLCAYIPPLFVGLVLMAMFMDRPRGYVCRVQRGEITEIPDCEETFPNLLIVLASVLNIKVIPLQSNSTNITDILLTFDVESGGSSRNHESRKYRRTDHGGSF
jgi:hypothetical protein